MATRMDKFEDNYVKPQLVDAQTSTEDLDNCKEGSKKTTDEQKISQMVSAMRRHLKAAENFSSEVNRMMDHTKAELDRLVAATERTMTICGFEPPDYIDEDGPSSSDSSSDPEEDADSDSGISTALGDFTVDV